MSPEDQAVYFNAVPLFILAGAYLMVATALAPTLWRERRRVSVTDVGLAAIFPGIAIPAAIFGAVVLHDRSPIGGHVWPPFVATLIALVPALIFLRRWSEPAGVVMSGGLGPIGVDANQSRISNGTTAMFEAIPYASRSTALMRPSWFESGTTAGASL